MYTVGIKRWFGFKKFTVKGHDWRGGRLVLNLVDGAQLSFRDDVDVKIFADFWSHIGELRSREDARYNKGDELRKDVAFAYGRGVEKMVQETARVEQEDAPAVVHTQTKRTPQEFAQATGIFPPPQEFQQTAPAPHQAIHEIQTHPHMMVQNTNHVDPRQQEVERRAEERVRSIYASSGIN